MTDCPTCERMLASERGMRQHHTKVHDEPLPNRECSGCGTEFYDPKARLEYCDDCNPNAGEHNGNYRDATATTDCERCGDEFEYYPSDKDGVYCPACVEAAADFLGTPYAEVHDIEPEEQVCENCFRIFEILPCDLRCTSGRFCSQSCFHAWLADNRDEPPSPYKGRWFTTKQRALERDNHQCQHCGADARTLGQEPDVHHIVPVRDFDDPQNAHFLENLVSLCRSCHLKVEHGSIQVSKILAGSQSRNS